MPVPDFSPGEVLTAQAMDSIGLWLISTTTVGTGVPTVPVNSCFSANYDNYRIIISGMNTSSNGTGIKLLLGGVTGNTYFSYSSWQAWGATAPAGQGYAASNSGFFIGYSGIGTDTFCTIDISNPQKNIRTMLNFQNVSSSYQSTGGGLCDSTVQSTGFTIDLDGAATMTGGTIRVYGYRN